MNDNEWIPEGAVEIKDSESSDWVPEGAIEVESPISENKKERVSTKESIGNALPSIGALVGGIGGGIAGGAVGHPHIGGALGVTGGRIIGIYEKEKKSRPLAQQALLSALPPSLGIPALIATMDGDKRKEALKDIGTTAVTSAMLMPVSWMGVKAVQSLTNAVKGVGSMTKYGGKTSDVMRTKFAQTIRGALSNIKKNIVEKYGTRYGDIVQNAGDNKISLMEPIQDFFENADDAVNVLSSSDDFAQELAKENPMARRLLNVVNKFKEAKVSEIENLGVKEADDVVKFINNLPGIKTKLGKLSTMGKGNVDFTNSERILMEFANDVKAKILEVAPDLSGLKSEYSMTMNNLRKLRPMFRFGQAEITAKNLHNLPGEVRETIRETLPQDVVKEIFDFNYGSRLGEMLKKFALYSAGTAGAGMVGGQVVRSATQTPR